MGLSALPVRSNQVNCVRVRIPTVRTSLLLAAVPWAAALVAGCRWLSSGVEYPDAVTVEWRVLAELSNGVRVYNGGYGSAIAPHPTRKGYFYLLTDRGPNVDTAQSVEKRFVRPSFTPRIELFTLDGTRLAGVQVIELKDSAGRRLTGLPNPPVADGNGEVAVDLTGQRLPFDPDGIDPEGLVALRQGGFWISDEYGPHLLHVDRTGRTIERVSPAAKNRQGHALPKVFALRRPNRGMEGLTITSDGRLLVGIMQSALDNPSAAVRTTTRATRLLTYDLVTGATHQFVYLQEQPDLSNSEIASLSRTEFLVLERDDRFGGDPAAPAPIKRIYKVDLNGATDLSDSADRTSGRLFDGDTLEQLTDEQFRSAGIVPVAKTLVADLLALPGGYPHDKPEGLAILDRQLLAVCNDDDFGITSDGSGALIQKIFPAVGNIVDRSQVFFLKLKAPLW